MRKKGKSKTKVLVITSGKGGVGKTTTSANIAMGIAKQGLKTAVLDFDVGLRNLDIIMGCERRVIYDMAAVIEGKARLDQALIQDKRCKDLYILAASQTHDKDSLTKDGVLKIIDELKKQGFDYVVCDSPAGIEAGALHAMYYADEALIVVNPEVSSIRDSDRVIGLLDAKTHRAETGMEPIKKSLLVTRYDPERVKSGQMLAIEDINEILSLKLIGIIPESIEVIDASNKGAPVINNEKSIVADSYSDCVGRLLGQEIPFRHINGKKGLFSRLFGG